MQSRLPALFVLRALPSLPTISVRTTCGVQGAGLNPGSSTHAPLAVAERERVSVTNLASTMVTLLLSNPALRCADLSSLRLASCGGSPLPPADAAAAIAAFGCRVFVSYGMTECCGKIAVSLPPADGAAAMLSPADQLALICTSGRRVFCLNYGVIGRLTALSSMYRECCRQAPNQCSSHAEELSS